MPIALKAGEQEKTGWRETTVRVAWDNHEKVHRLPLLYVPPSADLLANGDMERPSAKELAHWIRYEDGGYTVDTEVRHSGARSLHAFNNSQVKAAGATQTVVLNQKTARPLVLRGWSLYRKPGGADETKTIGMTELGALGGERSADYSLYVDLHYGDGGALYGQAAMFDKSLNSWQFAQKVIVVARPVKDATVYLLFRNQEGEAWFDDVSLAEADPDLALAPGAQALTDSCYQGYTPKPLTDGLVDVKDVSWSEAAWASAESEGEHWVEIVLPQAVPVKTVILQWSLDGGVWASRKYSVQVFAEGAWRDVASVEDGEAAEYAVHAFDPVATHRVRVLQPKGGGPAGRPMIMWVREVEVY